jgi:hypothetical protein
MVFKNHWRVMGVTVAVAIALVAGIAIAAQIFDRSVPGTVNVIATGDITVDPETFDLGDVNRDEVVSLSFTVTNNTDGDLTVTADDLITASLVSTGTDFTLCSVDATTIEGTLTESASISGNCTFTINHGALAGDSTFTWVVEGSTIE